MFSNIFASLFDRILTIFLVLLFAQAPVYIAQYIDVLAGAEMEARQSYEEILLLAGRKGLSVEQYVEETKARTPSSDVAYDYVEIVARSVERYERYQEALYELRESSFFLKPFILIRYFDSSIHEAMSFEAGFQFNLQTLWFALMGIVVSMIISYFIGKVARRYQKSRKKRSR